MNPLKQIYLNYWKQLKLFVDGRDLNWGFYSLEGEAEAIVKIGTPHHKICLSLSGPDSKNPRRSISASFWIPDSKETFAMLQSKRVAIESEMGKSLVC